MSNAPSSFTKKEIQQLCAVDANLFCREFFPKTVRQPSPVFHRHMWRLLESNNRLVNLQVYRGGAKTSICRMYSAKQVAYGFSRTIVSVGKSEGHAIRSIKWLRQHIKFNRKFSEFYGLRPGSKWQDTEAEIIHEGLDMSIWLVALGITGSTRGVNLDDYRPDLIIVDDVQDEENSATPEQRKKISELVYGALMESLAPASESPDAKMIMTQTPLNREDVSTLALSDPAWVSAKYSCFTPETTDLDIDHQVSSWPERWSSQTLRKEKRQAIARNQLSLWLREKECKLISPETSAFKEEWLRYYDILPERMTVVMAIDPVPPPSEIQVEKGMRGKDFEAFAVVGMYRGNFFLLDYSLNRGHEPDWTIAEFFRLALKWRPRTVYVEAVAYQRTLDWLLRQAMKVRRQYFVLEPFTDKRRKFDRIIQGLSGPASNGALHVNRSHADFIAAFREYPDVANDDLIEAVAVAVSMLNDVNINLEMADYLFDEEEDLPAISFQGAAP